MNLATENPQKRTWALSSISLPAIGSSSLAMLFICYSSKSFHFPFHSYGVHCGMIFEHSSAGMGHNWGLGASTPESMSKFSRLMFRKGLYTLKSLVGFLSSTDIYSFRKRTMHGFQFALLVTFISAIFLVETVLGAVRVNGALNTRGWNEKGHWVTAWGSMPQLCEPANLPPPPFVCEPCSILKKV